MPTHHPARPPPGPQAVEIDELQRQQSEAFSLRQQLATVRQSEAQLKRRVGELSQLLAQQAAQQAGSGAASPARSEASSRGAAAPAASGSSRGVAPSGRGSPRQSPSRMARSGSGVGSAASARAQEAGPSGALPAEPQQLQLQQEGGGRPGKGGMGAEEAEALRHELSRLRHERDRLQVGPAGWLSGSSPALAPTAACGRSLL